MTTTRNDCALYYFIALDGLLRIEELGSLWENLQFWSEFRFATHSLSVIVNRHERFMVSWVPNEPVNHSCAPIGVGSDNKALMLSQNETETINCCLLFVCITRLLLSPSSPSRLGACSTRWVMKRVKPTKRVRELLWNVWNLLVWRRREAQMYSWRAWNELKDRRERSDLIYWDINMEPSFVQRLPINNIHVLFTLGGACSFELLAIGGRVSWNIRKECKGWPGKHLVPLCQTTRAVLIQLLIHRLTIVHNNLGVCNVRSTEHKRNESENYRIVYNDYRHEFIKFAWFQLLRFVCEIVFVGDFVKHIIAKTFIPISECSAESLTGSSHEVMEFETIMSVDRLGSLPSKRNPLARRWMDKTVFNSLQHDL